MKKCQSKSKAFFERALARTSQAGITRENILAGSRNWLWPDQRKNLLTGMRMSTTPAGYPIFSWVRAKHLSSISENGFEVNPETELGFRNRRHNFGSCNQYRCETGCGEVVRVHDVASHGMAS